MFIKRWECPSCMDLALGLAPIKAPIGFNLWPLIQTDG
jgi:hypothetical protein